MIKKECYEKEIAITRFRKIKETKIENVHPNDIVYISIKSPLNYGRKEWEYFGKLFKVTDCYFWFTEYCEYDRHGNNYCELSYIEKRDSDSKRAKKWKKSSIISIWLADATTNIETHKYWNITTDSN